MVSIRNSLQSNNSPASMTSAFMSSDIKIKGSSQYVAIVSLTSHQGRVRKDSEDLWFLQLSKFDYTTSLIVVTTGK